MARVVVRVIPRASRDEVVGWRGDELIVRVKAVPEKGRANDSAIALVASALGVPRGAVRLVAGASNRRKVLDVACTDGPDGSIEVGHGSHPFVYHCDREQAFGSTGRES